MTIEPNLERMIEKGAISLKADFDKCSVLLKDGMCLFGLSLLGPLGYTNPGIMTTTLQNESSSL